MRYFTFFMAAIGLAVLVVVIIIKLLTSGPQKQAINLNGYANSGAVAQLTIDGPITDNQEHQQIQITVGNTNTQFQILTGYQGQVAMSKSFTNNQAAYAVFLHALTLSGFTKGNADPSLGDDRGFCPDGDRYVLQLEQGSKTIEHYWATSCGGQGTYSGDLNLTLDLFQKQVPDYTDLVSDVIL